MSNENLKNIAERLLAGDRRALARLITRVESRDPEIAGILGELYSHTGNADIIGITGPPGAGKSTITDKLISRFRDQKKKVGVVAIDPSSPFSGGALLGDRVRMMQHATDQDVFIRSLGSRGSYGGLSRATSEIVGLMDAFGFDVIIVETVGVGQTELDVMDLAHSVIVVFVPESGDVVQTMKAGLTEIADIFVVNKCDRPGADSMARELDQMVDYNSEAKWRIPVLQTIALKNEGIDELYEQLEKHRLFLESGEKCPETLGKMRLNRFVDVFSGLISDKLLNYSDLNGDLGEIAKNVYEGRVNPYIAAQKILSDPRLLGQFVLKKGDST